jgi:CRP/FNR family transcriptional regulator, cyclic AMP receptor protein
MKSFPWQNLLRPHPLFAHLPQEELDHLLGDEFSQERHYPQDAVILNEGEVGDSIFLIGSGAVRVTLRGTGGPVTLLAILEAGDIFGEMAVLEHTPRSATVSAKEECVLLEIAGERIRALLDTHPRMQVVMYTLVRDRLRQWFHRLGVGDPR